MDATHTVVSDTPTAAAYKPRGRKTTSATKGGRTPKPVTRRPIKLVVDTDVYETMVVHGLRNGLNLSELVSTLVRKHCNEYVVHRKPGPQHD